VAYAVSPARRVHILDGDASGGGHRFGTKQNNSKFPQNWSDHDIISSVEEVANDQQGSSFLKASRGCCKVIGKRKGVVIVVIVDPRTGEIVTAHPSYGEMGGSDA
jgi:hypothetical protein